jgi:uncharacterized membrane protein YtjA (UPF0391 family)
MDEPMLSWSLAFIGIALITGLLGFGWLAGISVSVANALFLLFALFAVVSFVLGLTRREA